VTNGARVHAMGAAVEAGAARHGCDAAEAGGAY
jgi:hypothetical protein